MSDEDDVLAASIEMSRRRARQLMGELEVGVADDCALTIFDRLGSEPVGYTVERLTWVSALVDELESPGSSW